MTKNDFSLYNNFPASVMVLDSMQKVVFKNAEFLKNFGAVKNLEKFANYFSFDVCILDSENILNSNPVVFALKSKENFTAQASYQRAKEQQSHYLITSFCDKDFKILVFKNITTDVLYEESEKKYLFIRQQYLTLVEDNKRFVNLQQNLQAQAVKLALMHRVTNVIRESIDIEKIVISTLTELFNLFGAIKIYYAQVLPDEDKFCINAVYPQKYKSVIGEIVEFSAENKKAIKNKIIKINSCIKEYLNSQITYPMQVQRIVSPVYRAHDLHGVLIIYTNQKYYDEAQNDVLQSISAQLASALVQASLFLQVNQKNNELENTLKELKETQIQLINSEKMASLGQLVAGVAHEINTPLGAINSNNDMIAKLIDKLSLENHNSLLLANFKNLNKIDKEAIKRISGIVKSLKRFVRLDESELQFADINDELDLTLELIKHETKNKIEIIKNYGEIPDIKCYPNMLNQVFMNILINACHSINNNGEITISTQAKNGDLIVKIKDNGCGIEDNIKDKLFNAGVTTKKIGMGSGLGLAISKKIIEKHNGSISFESQKNIGTEFTIKIPCNLLD